MFFFTCFVMLCRSPEGNLVVILSDKLSLCTCIIPVLVRTWIEHGTVKSLSYCILLMSLKHIYYRIWRVVYKEMIGLSSLYDVVVIFDTWSDQKLIWIWCKKTHSSKNSMASWWAALRIDVITLPFLNRRSDTMVTHRNFYFIFVSKKWWRTDKFLTKPKTFFYIHIVLVTY